MLQAFERRLADSGLAFVSFDVFDTLLCRPTHRPGHMFQVIGAAAEQQTSVAPLAFAALRRRAENEVRVSARATGRQEVELAEIYRRLCALARLAPDAAQTLAAIEESVERANFFPSSRGRAMVDIARKAGKRIIFLSDTYFSERFMRDALGEMLEPPDELILSSISGKTKHSGDLYRTLLTGRPPRSVLHVGDNLGSDIRQALKMGVSVFHARSGRDRARERGYLFSSSDHLPASIAQALVDRSCLELDDDPSRGAAYKNLGYCVLGPFWVGFMQFIASLAERERVEKLYFLARDGFVLQKAYEKWCGQTGVYMSVSRHILYLSYAHLDFEDALPLLLQNYAEDSVSEVIARLVPEDCDPRKLDLPHWARATLDEKVNSADVRDRLARLARLLTPQIKANAARHFETTAAYFRQIGLTGLTTAGIVDLGWHGSLQVVMQRLLTAMGCRVRLVGMYAGLFSHARQPVGNDLMSGYLFQYGQRAEAEKQVQCGPSVLEVLHAAPFGTTIGYRRAPSGEMQPVYAPSEAEERQYAESVRIIHEGGLQFVDDFLATLSRLAPSATVDASLDYATNLLRLVSRPSVQEAMMVSVLGLHPNFGPSSEIIRLLEERGNKGRSMWPIGRSMLFRRTLPEWFDEDRYLAERPDVLAAVRTGDFTSGYQHYVRHGKDEMEPQP